MANELAIKFDGPGMSLAKFPLKDLAEFLDLLAQAVELESEPATEARHPEDDALLSLTRLKNGSADYGISCAERAKPAAERIFDGFQIKSIWRTISPKAQDCASRAFRLTNKLGMTAVVTPTWAPHKRRSIQVERDIPEVDKSRFYFGETTVRCFINKAGGIGKYVCDAKDEAGSKLKILCDKPTVKALAETLYDTVEITGKATWRMDDDELIQIEATGVRKVVLVDIDECMQRLFEVKTAPWNTTTSAELMQYLRGEEE
jgi:hypothetical protein